MKTEVILKVINFMLLLSVPVSVVFLIALLLVTIEGKPIKMDLVFLLFSIVIITVLLKFVKHRISKF